MKTNKAALTKIGLVEIAEDFVWRLATFKQLGIWEHDLWLRMCLQRFGAQMICWLASTHSLSGDNGGLSTKKHKSGFLVLRVSTLTRTHLQKKANIAFKEWFLYLMWMSTREVLKLFQTLQMMKPKNTSEVLEKIMETRTGLLLIEMINSKRIKTVSS